MHRVENKFDSLSPLEKRNIKFSAALMTGGKSSRMGRDKAFLQINQISLWRFQLKKLAKLSPQKLFISAHQGQIFSSFPQIEVVYDELADQGPLSGIASCLNRIETPLLLVLAVDLPHMQSAFLEKALSLTSPTQGIVFQTRHGYEPLAAIYPKSALPIAQQCLHSDDRSLNHYLQQLFKKDQMRSQSISAEEEYLFTNVNTPKDLINIL